MDVQKEMRICVQKNQQYRLSTVSNFARMDMKYEHKFPQKLRVPPRMRVRTVKDNWNVRYYNNTHWTSRVWLLLIVYEHLCLLPETDCYLGSLCLLGLKLCWEKAKGVILHIAGLPEVILTTAPGWPSLCILTDHWLKEITVMHGQKLQVSTGQNEWWPRWYPPI